MLNVFHLNMDLQVVWPAAYQDLDSHMVTYIAAYMWNLDFMKVLGTISQI